MLISSHVIAIRGRLFPLMIARWMRQQLEVLAAAATGVNSSTLFPSSALRWCHEFCARVSDSDRVCKSMLGCRLRSEVLRKHASRRTA